MNTYQVIDEKNWERAMHCMVFRESVEPASPCRIEELNVFLRPSEWDRIVSSHRMAGVKLGIK